MSHSLLVEADLHEPGRAPSFLQAFGSGARYATLKRSLVPMTICAGWSLLVYLVWGGREKWMLPQAILNVAGLVIGLLLAFRTNGAYERFNEGRKTWATTQTILRNMTRAIWEGTEDVELRNKGLKLCVGYLYALKAHLRDQDGYTPDDVRDFLSPTSTQGKPNLALDVLLQLTNYVKSLRTTEKANFDQACLGTLTGGISQLTDNLGVFERIRDSPPPLAYMVHVRQIIVLYMAALPFNLVKEQGWQLVPFMALAAFIIFGLESIAVEIEDPFGTDKSDLPLDRYCAQFKQEVFSNFQ